jgi:hypothetical protein
LSGMAWLTAVVIVRLAEWVWLRVQLHSMFVKVLFRKIGVVDGK